MPHSTDETTSENHCRPVVSDSTVVSVQAPSRLHFGLWSLTAGEPGAFGGAGTMIDRPGLLLEARFATRPGELTAHGPLAQRALSFARYLRQRAATGASFRGVKGDARGADIEIRRAGPGHGGLGSGTQLALAVGVALEELWGWQSGDESNVAAPRPVAVEQAVSLAMRLGRARRSSVGAYGFALGGTIIDGGHHTPDSERDIGALDAHIPTPDDWRVLLVTVRGQKGLHGSTEVEAFRRAPPIPTATTDRLMRLARQEIVPAVRRADFEAFAQAVYEYGRVAGECFSFAQKGPYAGPEITAVIEQLRRQGAVGVGQSSWGPTVFAFFPSPDTATQAVADFPAPFADRCDLLIARPSNEGARVTVCE